MLAALHEVLDLPGERPTYSPFGWGFDHAFGKPIIAEIVAASRIPPERHEFAISDLQFGALVGSADDTPGLPSDHPLHSRPNNGAYVAQRTNLGDNMTEWSRDSVRADNFTLASELVDLMPIIETAARTVGRSSSDLVALGREGLERFMSLLPMESVVAHLHRSVMLMDRTWQLNDHNDVVYLGAAAAYCDAVVGERHWTAQLNHPRCPTKATFVGSSPEDLRHLVSTLP